MRILWISFKKQEKMSQNWDIFSCIYYSARGALVGVTSTSSGGVSSNSFDFLGAWIETIASSGWERIWNFFVFMTRSLTWSECPIVRFEISRSNPSTISVGRHLTLRTSSDWWSCPPSKIAGLVPTILIAISTYTSAFILTTRKSICWNAPVTGWRWVSCTRTLYDFFSTLRVMMWLLPDSRKILINSDTPTVNSVEGVSLPYKTAGIAPFVRAIFAISVRIFASRENII